MNGTKFDEKEFSIIQVFKIVAVMHSNSLPYLYSCAMAKEQVGPTCIVLLQIMFE